MIHGAVLRIAACMACLVHLRTKFVYCFAKSGRFLDGKASTCFCSILLTCLAHFTSLLERGRAPSTTSGSGGAAGLDQGRAADRLANVIHSRKLTWKSKTSCL